MFKLPTSASVATMLAAFALSGAAAAQSTGQAISTGIQRCEASDGTAIYTDRTCAEFGATARPMSGELLARVSYADNGSEAGAFGSRRASTVARRSAASGCARSATQLTMDLQGAWASGDVNRIAESYHWVGLGADQANSIMQRLERLAAQPLWQAHYFDARIGGGMLQFADASVAAPASAGMMQLVFDDGASQRVQDFDVRRYHGCYFVEF